MERVTAEWSLGKDSDLMVEIWSTGALVAAVIGALLEEPANLRLALAALRASRPTA
jgi:hypothetical protein